MTINSKERKRKLLALFLSAMMATSFATAFAACSDEEETKTPETEDSTDTTAEKDDSRINNGSFSYYDKEDELKLIVTSPGGWSRSNDAGGSTSKAASGIINTATDAWNNLTTASGKSYATVKEAEDNWESLTAKDKLLFYEEQEDEDELDFYQNFNIDADDLPTCDNPGTHYAATETDADTNVLMIHNDYDVSGKFGTAQKFSSSSTVTIPAGTYAELSLWVKTTDLRFGTRTGDDDQKGQEVVANRGAYIDITQTVGGKTLDSIQVKNINTEVQADASANNGWVQYKFYLQGNSYATSTVKVVVGLGQAKVSTNTWEYVSGYAFFDDVECNIYESKEGWNDGAEVNFDMNSPKADKTVDADTNSAKAFSMDMDKTDDEFAALKNVANKTTTALTEEKAGNGKVYVSAAAEGKLQYNGLTIKADDLTASHFGATTFGTIEASSDALVAKVKDNLTKPATFSEDSDELILLLSGEGAAYTATLKDNSEFKVEAGKYSIVSFFVKTSDLAGHTGAGVTFTEVDENGNELGASASLATIDTTDLSGVNLTFDKLVDGKIEQETKEDIYEGWQQCFYFLKNDTEEDRYFEIKLTYGTTSIVGSTDEDYYGGYAAFANFETRAISQDEYAFASDGTYTKTLALTGKEESENEGTYFDDASAVGGDIETGLANPLNYKGVNGGSGFVNGTSTDATINSNEYAGLINKANLEDWESNEVNDAIKAKITKELLADATQPLLIYNNEAKAYGYIGATKTLAASTHATVSVRVLASAGATANVYLVDMNDESHESTLVWNSGRTYWYDDDGNICTVDPTSDEFGKADVAFKLQSNGLYLVNTKWNGYAASGVKADEYYANLANYEKDSVTGDLLVAEGGVEYSYNSNWQNDGNDGIAFYAKDGKYYAYSNYTTEVKDLATVTGLTPRYEAQEDIALTATVNGDAITDKWVTVTFYLHSGSEAKNYRLEVWSGSRDNTAKNAAGTYVLFDASGASTLTDDTFSSLVEESKENIEDSALTNVTGVSYEGVYSFYDAASFLRYDASLDENEVGNSYESYLSSAYTEGVAYLKYEDSISLLNVTFVDFNLSEVTVAADVETEDTDTEEEEETTQSNPTNIWLLASSVALAAILLLAVVSIIVRKFVLKAIKKKSREISAKAASTRKEKVKKVKAVKEEKKDEDSPYND